MRARNDGISNNLDARAATLNLISHGQHQPRRYELPSCADGAPRVHSIQGQHSTTALKLCMRWPVLGGDGDRWQASEYGSDGYRLTPCRLLIIGGHHGQTSADSQRQLVHASLPQLSLVRPSTLPARPHFLSPVVRPALPRPSARPPTANWISLRFKMLPALRRRVQKHGSCAVRGVSTEDVDLDAGAAACIVAVGLGANSLKTWTCVAQEWLIWYTPSSQESLSLSATSAVGRRAPLCSAPTRRGSGRRARCRAGKST
jgi:hypothetical protein